MPRVLFCQSCGILTFCQGSENVLAGPTSAGLLSGGLQRDSYGVMRYKALHITSFRFRSMLLQAWDFPQRCGTRVYLFGPASLGVEMLISTYILL